MDSHLSPSFKKWMKKCLSDEFSKAIDDNLTAEGGDRDPYDVAQKIINSPHMSELTHAIRTSFVEQIDASRATTRQNSARNSSRPHTSLSAYMNELTTADEDDDNWSLTGGSNTDEIGQIVERMGQDKPDHVRLAGYEALLETAELANLFTNNSWQALLKTLRDALVDGGRSVFEASLTVHAKLLNCPQFSDAYANLINAFEELHNSKKLCDTLPTLLSGINFKVFLHEKLIRSMRLILDHHEEILKGTRTIDKRVEEMIEQFVAFLCSHQTSSSPTKPLSTLHVLSVIEPQAGWSKRWMHGLTTRKSLCTALSKSPTFAQTVVSCVKKSLQSPPTKISAVVSDEPTAFVSGESVDTLTFLHCLNLLAQLCACSTGRTLLAELLQADDNRFSVPDFLTSLLSTLNAMASSDASNGVYESIRSTLRVLLRKSSLTLYDARFYQLALSPLGKTEGTRLWPHTLDALTHMLDTADGATFLTSESRANSASLESKTANYPVLMIVGYAASVFRQPIAVMAIEHVTGLCRLVGELFQLRDIFYIVEEIARETFYPSVSYLYSKLDKYFAENENKTQRLDKAIREMLLQLVSIPLGLQMLANEPLVFEELARGSIAPVRASWSAYDVVAFVSNSGFLARGAEILADLAPHALSTLLAEIDKLFEDMQLFHDPWDSENVRVFAHVLALLSMNTCSFLAFMAHENESNAEEEFDYPTNLYEFFQDFANPDKPYHQLGLLTCKSILWNLDIYVYLINLLDFENKLLEYQGHNSYVDDSGIEEKSVIVVDECDLLRHSILLDCYYVRHRRAEYAITPEESRLFCKFPPPSVGIEDGDVAATSASDDSEIATWLRDSGPGLRDNNWVLGTRKAHRASPAAMKDSVLLDLLEQMEQAIPTVEWVDRFRWTEEFEASDDYWFPEDLRAIDLIVHYGAINKLIEDVELAKSDLKLFIQSSHDFINYPKPVRFQGFDWFLATVFLICHGDFEKAKTFISRIIRFPSAMFMWPALGRVVDENNEEEASTRLLLAHLLESAVSLEFPTIKFALKNECGVDWWMICNQLSTQCFIGILPWSEIVHYFAICILHSPDYVLYYCASLLNHCEGELMKSVSQGKMWPEHIVLEDYRCHSQIGFMDRLGKRHGGKLLPPLTQQSLNVLDNN